MKKKKFLGLLLFGALMFASCSEHFHETPQSEVAVTYNLSADLQNAKASNVRVTFFNVNTGRSTVVESKDLSKTWLEDGLYNVMLEGNVAYKVNGSAVNARLRAVQNNVTIAGGKANLNLVAEAVSVKEGFVFAEIAVAGTLDDNKKQYNSDKYFRIYNNSDETLYADGLVLFESEFLNDMPQDYRPDVRDSALAISVAYMVPGNGTEHPVAPGQSILLVDLGLDHTKTNHNSYNLSKADFEWYDKTESGGDTDTDVPNLIKLITMDGSRQMGVWMPHTRGVKTYAIGYLGDAQHPVSAADYVQNYAYHYEYDFTFKGITYPMDGDAYIVPNAWIAYCVNMCPKEAPKKWLCSASRLDAGFAYNSVLASDKNRYGMAIRRKVDPQTHKLVDTNNSTNDFESMVKANPYYQFFK